MGHVSRASLVYALHLSLAHTRAGGARPAHPPPAYPPTLLSRRRAVAKEEIFGPVMQLMTFKTIEEAIERANNTHCNARQSNAPPPPRLSVRSPLFGATLSCSYQCA